MISGLSCLLLVLYCYGKTDNAICSLNLAIELARNDPTLCQRTTKIGILETVVRHLMVALCYDLRS